MAEKSTSWQRAVRFFAPAMVVVLPCWFLAGEVFPALQGWTTQPGLVPVVVTAVIGAGAMTALLVAIRARRVRPAAAGRLTSLACACYWGLSVLWPLAVGAVGDAPGEVAPLVRWGMPQEAVNTIGMMTGVGAALALIAMVSMASYELDPRRQLVMPQP